MRNRTSPLTITCLNGYDDTIQLLLSNGVDINLCNVNEAGPLYIACQNGDGSTEQFLLRYEADINPCM